MEDEKKLYPLSFCPVQDDYQWGGEEFLLADLGYRDTFVGGGWLASNTISEVMDTYMDRVVGDNVYERFGRQFPLCVRVLHVKGKMPLRVCPDDETARERYDLLGKEKLWYIADAGPDARILLGFGKDTDASALYSACAGGDVESLMNVVTPRKGEFVRIPSGTPHAASGTMTIYEIAESSPLDFCLSGLGSEVSTDEFDETLGLVDALDFINYGKHSCAGPAAAVFAADKPRTLHSCEQFEVNALSLENPVKVGFENTGSFLLYCCVSGAAEVQLPVMGSTASFKLRAGACLLLPEECPDFVLVPTAAGTKILEICVPPIQEADPYINPDVPSTVDDPGSQEPSAADLLAERFNKGLIN